MGLHAGARARLGILLLALAPSAYLAWNWRAMPQLNLYHDDALYWVSAKALGTGHGYRIESLPGEPWQTKYPPLFPAMLALVWKLDPVFPGNLKLATLVAWVAMPLYLLLALAWIRGLGLSDRESTLLVILAGASPVACVLAITLMSELWFTALLVACIILAERAGRSDGSAWIALAGGVLAGLAYLTRSAALPLLVTVPFCLLLRRQWRRAAVFAASMLPFIAAWELWVAAHLSHARDLITLYYTNYLGFQIYNVGIGDIPRVVWYNFDSLTRAIGKLLTFDLLLLDSKSLERVVAAGAVAGVIRLARRTGQWQYPAAGLGMIGLMLVWHFPPNERFLMPLFPLFAAGLWTELQNFGGALRQAWGTRKTGERVVAGALTAVLACFAGLIVATYSTGDFLFIPQLAERCRTDLRANGPAYAWLARNTPADATVYAYQDPLTYLYTGRHAAWLPVPPKYYYREGSAPAEQFVSTAPALAREEKLEYMLLTPSDYYLDPYAVTLREACHRSIASDGEFREAFDSGGVKVFRRASR